MQAAKTISSNPTSRSLTRTSALAVERYATNRMTSGWRHAGTGVRFELIACVCAVSHSPHDLGRGSRGKECGSRASARRLIPFSVRVTSQLPISRSSSVNNARLRAISCSMSMASLGLSAVRRRILSRC
jgi:hypothetical protein